jgi:hypothetical protein
MSEESEAGLGTAHTVEMSIEVMATALVTPYRNAIVLKVGCVEAMFSKGSTSLIIPDRG